MYKLIVQVSIKKIAVDPNKLYFDFISIIRNIFIYSPISYRYIFFHVFNL